MATKLKGEEIEKLKYIWKILLQSRKIFYDKNYNFSELIVQIQFGIFFAIIHIQMATIPYRKKSKCENISVKFWKSGKNFRSELLQMGAELQLKNMHFLANKSYTTTIYEFLARKLEMSNFLKALNAIGWQTRIILLQRHLNMWYL